MVRIGKRYLVSLSPLSSLNCHPNTVSYRYMQNRQGSRLSRKGILAVQLHHMSRRNCTAMVIEVDRKGVWIVLAEPSYAVIEIIQKGR